MALKDTISRGIAEDLAQRSRRPLKKGTDTSFFLRE
jgi:hypothetical protein